MQQSRNKILIVVDGSNQSLNVIKYLSSILSPDNNELILFHVYKEIPDPYMDLNIHPEFKNGTPPLKAWASREQKMVKDFMKRAYNIIIDNGFKREHIRINTQPLRKGIARDILEESKKGYIAIAAGRTGISNIKGISIGSITSKLIEKVRQATLIIIGGKPEVKNILIGHDGSKYAKNCVERVGSMIGRPDCNVKICHVIRSLRIIQKVYGAVTISDENEKEWKEIVKREYRPLIDEARYFLTNSGFSWSRIENKIIASSESRAKAIVDEAENSGCGTIAVGRRGLTVVKDFYMGRVSNKILSLAEDRAVWIVK